MFAFVVKFNFYRLMLARLIETNLYSRSAALKARMAIVLTKIIFL